MFHNRPLLQKTGPFILLFAIALCYSVVRFVSTPFTSAEAELTSQNIEILNREAPIGTDLEWTWDAIVTQAENSDFGPLEYSVQWCQNADDATCSSTDDDAIIELQNNSFNLNANDTVFTITHPSVTCGRIGVDILAENVAIATSWFNTGTPCTKNILEAYSTESKSLSDDQRTLIQRFAGLIYKYLALFLKPSNKTNNPDRDGNSGIKPPTGISFEDTPAGFANATIGGENGPVLRVTSLADDKRNPAEGTFRWAAAQDGASIIEFDVSGTINLEDDVEIKSFTTIDGRGQDVTFSKFGLKIRNAENVIIRNISLIDGVGADDSDCEGTGDAITVQRSSNVWIDHTTLSHYCDGLLDIVNGSTDVTISWNTFSNHNKTMLIGNSVESVEDANTRVTIHHNYFNGVRARIPRIRYAKVDMYNNYLVNWADNTISSQTGELLLENNVYEAGKRQVVTTNIEGGDTTEGFIRAIDNLQLNGAIVKSFDPDQVFTREYSIDLEPADTTLKEYIQSEAGAQPASVFSSGGIFDTVDQATQQESNPNETFFERLKRKFYSLLALMLRPNNNSDSRTPIVIDPQPTIIPREPEVPGTPPKNIHGSADIQDFYRQLVLHCPNRNRTVEAQRTGSINVYCENLLPSRYSAVSQNIRNTVKPLGYFSRMECALWVQVTDPLFGTKYLGHRIGAAKNYLVNPPPGYKSHRIYRDSSPTAGSIKPGDVLVADFGTFGHAARIVGTDTKNGRIINIHVLEANWNLNGNIRQSTWSIASINSLISRGEWNAAGWISH